MYAKEAWQSMTCIKVPNTELDACSESMLVLVYRVVTRARKVVNLIHHHSQTCTTPGASEQP